jgi:hypothetical protein
MLPPHPSRNPTFGDNHLKTGRNFVNDLLALISMRKTFWEERKFWLNSARNIIFMNFSSKSRDAYGEQVIY